MLHIWMGRAKTGKSNEVLQRIAQLGDSSRQILLVPEHASYQAEVDLCRCCGDTASRHAEVLSFRRLADRVIALSPGMSGVTLDAGGKLLALQRVMAELAPSLQVYRRPSQKAAFLQQLLTLFDEFHSYDVTAEVLYEKAEQIPGGTGEKLRDLSLIYGAYEAWLCRPGLDRRDAMTKLCEGLEESGYCDGKDIFIDGFTYFNTQERRVLEILFRKANSVTVTLLGLPDSREEIFESSLKTMSQLQRMAKEAGIAAEVRLFAAKDDTPLGHLERNFFQGEEKYADPQQAVQVLEADSLYSEVEQTAAAIRTLVAAGTCRYRDIRVSARNMNEYESTVETVFERYEIPVYHSRRVDILEKPVFALLTGVLTALENGLEYEDMFRWLKTGLAGISPQECDLLENYVLKWEIHGRMWLKDVDWTEDPEGYGGTMREAQLIRLAEINALRRRICDLLLPLEKGLKDGNKAKSKVDALYTFIEQIHLQTALEAQMNAQAEAGRMQEAEETAQLWQILCDVLDQFVEILGETEIDNGDFLRLFAQILTQYTVGTIPVSLDQVSVSEMTRNDRHTARYLFLLGVNDHVLPDPGQSGGILNEGDREELALQGVELAPSGMDRMGMELQNLYAILAQPTDGLFVSYPAADVLGNSLRPAFVVSRLQEIFPGLEVRREDYKKSYRLTAPLPALESAGTRQGGLLWTHFAGQGTFDTSLRHMEQAAALTRGALSRQAVKALYGERISMSASRLERMRTCHFAYFMEYGLRAHKRSKAEFDAPQIGTFLHYLLENVTRDVLDRGGFGAVDNEELHRLVRHYTEQYVEKEMHNFKDRNRRFRYLFSRLQRTAYAVIDQVAEEMRHSDFVPLAFELSFGSTGEVPGVVISEPDGELRLGGKVDRVDGWLKDDKLYLRVVDYKSGKKSFDLASVQMGLDIQMLLYLFALQKNGRKYFGHEIEPAGVLYLPARDEIIAVERNIPPEKLLQERQKTIKRSGLLLSEPAVLRAMEHEALEKPQYLPVRVGKDGSLSGSIASAAQLGHLGKYMDKLLHQITREVQQGNIDADPCARSEDESACRYCDWVDACHFRNGHGSDRLQYILPVKQEEFWDKLAREEEGTPS